MALLPREVGLVLDDVEANCVCEVGPVMVIIVGGESVRWMIFL